MIGVAALLACHAPATPPTDSASTPVAGVDVRSRAYDWLPGTPSSTTSAGISLSAARVAGRPMVLAGLSNGVAVEAFPSDGVWDVVRVSLLDEYPIGGDVALADWTEPIVASEDRLYTAALTSGEIGTRAPSAPTDGSASDLFFEDVHGNLGGSIGALRAADLDGDLVDDLLVSLGGRVLALRGPPGVGADVWSEPLFEVYGVLPVSGNFGLHIGAVGDLTGDGIPEMTFSSDDERGAGRVWIVPLGPLPRYALNTEVGWSIVGHVPGGRVGSSIAIGDVTGDGVNDVVAGAYLANGGAGEVYVYAGPVSEDAAFVDAVATLRWQGDAGGCGHAVEVLQDQDGDGHDEVAVGCPGDRSWEGERPGRVELYSGADLIGTLGAEDATLVLHTVNDPGPAWPDAFGSALAAGVDLTEDGLEDLVIGAPSERRNGGPGGVYVLHSPVIDGA